MKAFRINAPVTTHIFDDFTMKHFMHQYAIHIRV